MQTSSPSISSLDTEEALKLADYLILALSGKRLTNLQTLLVQGVWANRTYEEISFNHYYSADGIKKAASNLWKLLSVALGERITKSNFKAALERYAKEHPSLIGNESQSKESSLPRSAKDTFVDEHNSNNSIKNDLKASNSYPVEILQKLNRLEAMLEELSLALSTHLRAETQSEIKILKNYLPQPFLAVH